MPEREKSLRALLTSVPFAVIASLALIGCGAVAATGGAWTGELVLGATVFVGIVASGSAIRRHRQRRRR